MDVTHPSPNHSARKVPPDTIVLHATAGKRESDDVYWCCSPESKVSYHAIVGRNGTVYVMVPFDRKAWHAGKSEWEGRSNVNDFSIGLAFANRNDGEEALTPVQVAVMQALVSEIGSRWGIREVVTHTDIAPGRKHDPEGAVGFVKGDYAIGS